MNTTIKKHPIIVSLALCALIPTQLSADQFTVNSTSDPAIGDASACMGAAGACTLRDALAAAELTAQMDYINFDIYDPIYLSKPLSATHPVNINGGGTTTIRVHQGYSITTLEDRPAFGEGDVLVLQPTYFSPNGGFRAMLELSGAGSVVEDTIFDGSITAQSDDLGVARVDYDSNNTTDFLLYTVSSNENSSNDRWPIAGGIVAFGSSTIRNNELAYLSNSAISVEFSTGSIVADNTIHGGAVGQPAYAADGIAVYSALFTVVSGNSVSGYRNGVTFNTASGIEISGNYMTGNGDGVELDSVGTDFGAILVEDNEITHNLENGILIRWSEGAQVNNNEVNHNFQRGIHIKQAGPITISNNDSNHNGSGEMTHGGILINEGSGLVSVITNHVSHNQGFGVVIAESSGNTLSENQMIKNSGAGIVLLNGAQWNQLESNTVGKNAIGIISGLEDDELFPSNNLFERNKLKKNFVLDALDYDLDCNDVWLANTMNTSASASPGCFNQ